MRPACALALLSLSKLILSFLKSPRPSVLERKCGRNRQWNSVSFGTIRIPLRKHSSGRWNGCDPGGLWKLWVDLFRVEWKRFEVWQFQRLLVLIAFVFSSASGLKNAVDSIDNRADFKTFVQNYQVAHGRDYRGPRRDGPYEEGFVSSRIATSNYSVMSLCDPNASLALLLRSPPRRPSPKAPLHQHLLLLSDRSSE